MDDGMRIPLRRSTLFGVETPPPVAYTETFLPLFCLKKCSLPFPPRSGSACPAFQLCGWRSRAARGDFKLNVTPNITALSVGGFQMPSELRCLRCEHSQQGSLPSFSLPLPLHAVFYYENHLQWLT